MNEEDKDLEKQKRIAEKRSVDPDDQLHDAPAKGEVINDYFSFNEIFARILSTADHELNASNRYLIWSGLAAGFALGLTFLARVTFTEASGESEALLLGNLLYPVGFLIIVLGRYQLFTENTLTPVVLLLTRLASVVGTLRLWVIVLITNLVGAVGVAVLISSFEVLSPEQQVVAIEMGQKAASETWLDLFSRALFAGWIVASMVWLVHAARDTISRIFLIYILMYFVGVAHLYHIVTSSVEVFYLALTLSTVDMLPLFGSFVLPVLLGNTIGGVFFVALLNYALFAEHEDSELFKSYGEKLCWRDWVFGKRS